jgi:hypothetical protein
MKQDFNAPWEVKRPFICFARGFAALALLIAVGTPFMDDPQVNRWAFLLTGLAISAFFSFLATGLCLLPMQTRKRFMAGGVVFSSLFVLWLGAILASLYLQPSLAILHFLITRPFLWVLWTILAIGIAFACYGWYHRLFATLRHPASHV